MPRSTSSKAVHSNQQRAHSRDERRLIIVAIVTGLLVAVAGTRLDVLTRWLFLDRKIPLLMSDVIILISFVLLAFFIGWWFGIRGFRERFLRSNAVMAPVSGKKSYRAVVLALSWLKKGDQVQIVHNAYQWAQEQVALKGDSLDTRKAVLAELCQVQYSPLGEEHLWQQPLRVLQHNYDTVQVMAFALTPEVAKAQFDLFCDLLRVVAPDRMQILPAQHAAESFARRHWDYNVVYKQIMDMCEMALKAAKCQDDELSIDVTGSIKVYTAAATVMTLNRDAVFSYVVTSGDPDEGKVFSYDAMVV